jgi:hypothetical protein
MVSLTLPERWRSAATYTSSTKFEVAAELNTHNTNVIIEIGNNERNGEGTYCAKGANC